jgi:CBS domain-containing protein
MSLESAALLGETLHATFLECGLLPDEFITSRHAPWRSTKKELIGRLINGTKGGSPKELQELIAVVDQRLLYNENDFGAELRNECLKLISGSHSAVLMLIERLYALNSGIGLMGGVRLEKSGPGRGKFRLCANALQPLSYAVAALSLLKEETSFATPDRIRGLLLKGHLDVETAERLLNAWHNFNELRAVLENHVDGVNIDELYLDYSTMEESAQQEFKNSLEATAALLRHVFITFNSWEESR